MKSVSEGLQAMIDTLVAAQKDAAKFDRGNSAAGTRLRKVLHNVRWTNCVYLRVQISQERKQREEIRRERQRNAASPAE
jgi:hypothetical protein